MYTEEFRPLRNAVQIWRMLIGGRKKKQQKLQQLLPFLTLLPFNTSLHAVVTSTMTLFLLLLCIYNLATVMSHDVNMFSR